MPGISEFVVAAGVVEQGEEAHHFNLGRMVAAEVESVAQNGFPMARTVCG
jgi:hypothetical protein